MIKSLKKILLSVVVSAAMVVGLTSCEDKGKTEQIKSTEVVQKLTMSLTTLDPSTGIAISGNQSTKLGKINENSEFTMNIKMDDYMSTVEALSLTAEALPGLNVSIYSDTTASYVNLNGLKYASAPLIKPDDDSGKPLEAADPSDSSEQDIMAMLDDLFEFYKVSDASYYLTASNNGLLMVNTLIENALSSEELSLGFLKVTLSKLRVDLGFTKDEMINSIKLNVEGKVEANEKHANFSLKANVSLKTKVNVTAPSDVNNYQPINQIAASILAKPITAQLTLDFNSVMPSTSQDTTIDPQAVDNTEENNEFSGKITVDVTFEMETIGTSPDTMQLPKITLTISEDTLKIGDFVSSLAGQMTGTDILVTTKTVIYGYYYQAPIADDPSSGCDGLAFVFKDAEGNVLTYMPFDIFEQNGDTGNSSEANSPEVASKSPLNEGDSSSSEQEPDPNAQFYALLTGSLLSTLLFPTEAVCEDGKINLEVNLDSFLLTTLSNAFASLRDRMILMLGSNLVEQAVEKNSLAAGFAPETYDYASVSAFINQMLLSMGALGEDGRKQIAQLEAVQNLLDLFYSLPEMGVNAISLNFEYNEGVQLNLALLGTKGSIKLDLSLNLDLNQIVVLGMYAAGSFGIVLN